MADIENVTTKETIVLDSGGNSSAFPTMALIVLLFAAGALAVGYFAWYAPSHSSSTYIERNSTVVTPGEKGAPGETGAPGQTGASGQTVVTPGEQGAPGETGMQGEQGEPGYTGDRGRTGIQGEQGVPGEDAR